MLLVGGFLSFRQEGMKCCVFSILLPLPSNQSLTSNQYLSSTFFNQYPNTQPPANSEETQIQTQTQTQTEKIRQHNQLSPINQSPTTNQSPPANQPPTSNLQSSTTKLQSPISKQPPGPTNPNLQTQTPKIPQPNSHNQLSPISNHQSSPTNQPPPKEIQQPISPISQVLQNDNNQHAPSYNITLEQYLKQQGKTSTSSKYNLLSFGKVKGKFYWPIDKFSELKSLIKKQYDIANLNHKGIHSLIASRTKSEVCPLIIDMDYKPWQDKTKSFWENPVKPVYLPEYLPKWTAFMLRKLACEYTGSDQPIVVTKAQYDQHPAGQGHIFYHFHGPMWGLPWEAAKFPRNYLIEQAMQSYQLKGIKTCVCTQTTPCNNPLCGQENLWKEVFDGSIYKNERIVMRLYGAVKSDDKKLLEQFGPGYVELSRHIHVPELSDTPESGDLFDWTNILHPVHFTPMVKPYPTTAMEEATKKRKRDEITTRYTVGTKGSKNHSPTFVQDCISYVESLGHSIRQVKQENEYFYISLGKNDVDRTCPFAQRIHSSNNVDYIANPDTKELTLHCHKKCIGQNGKKRIVFIQQEDGSFQEEMSPPQKKLRQELQEGELLQKKMINVPPELTIFQEKYDSHLGDFTDWSMAQIIKHYLQDRAICVSSKQHLWYYFDNHRWKEDENANKTMVFMSLNVTKYAYEFWHHLVEVHQQASSSKETKYVIKELQTYIIKLIEKLQTHRNKQNILQECQQILANPQFEQELDVNPLLLGFENGIYDLESQTFRPGEPKDRVHLTTGYDFVDMTPEELAENPKFCMVQEAIENAIPEEDRYNFLMRFCASLCQGGNSEELFHIWTGTGGNCKGKMIFLLKKMLGEYAVSLPVEFLTRR